MKVTEKKTGGKNVLVVDDEKYLRDAIIFDLKRKGYTVFEAADGEAAFRIIESEKIDAVLSDVRMPVSSGLDLLAKIRDRHPDLPIVFLVTGFADLTEEDALKKGAKALLEKPIDRRKMLDLIAQHLD